MHVALGDKSTEGGVELMETLNPMRNLEASGEMDESCEFDGSFYLRLGGLQQEFSASR